jgi:hypothetical protein
MAGVVALVAGWGAGADWVSSASSASVGARRRRASPASRISPLMVRKMAAASGFGEQGAEGVFQGQPGDADGDGGDDQEPGESFVGVGGDDAARGDGGPKGAEEPADDAHPVGSEEDDQRQCGGHVQGDDDGQVRA